MVCTYANYLIRDNKIIEENIWKNVGNKFKAACKPIWLSFIHKKNELEVTVEISTSIIQLLQGVIDKTYNAQQNNGQINIKVGCKQATHDYTTLQPKNQ